MTGAGQLKELAAIGRRIEKMKLPEGVTWEYGGAMEYSRELLPGLILAVIAALCVMFIVLIVHYGKIGISILSISMAALCLFALSLLPHRRLPVPERMLWLKVPPSVLQ